MRAKNIKRPVSLYLEIDTIQTCVLRGINISHLVNKLLKDYLSSEDPEVLENEIEKELEERVEKHKHEVVALKSRLEKVRLEKEAREKQEFKNKFGEGRILDETEI